jgi:hypothetical protein
MIWGGINALEPPYTVRILCPSDLSKEIREEIETLQEALIEQRTVYRRLHGRDVPVDFEIVNQEPE